MVYTMSKRVNPSINALSTLVVVIITVVLVIINVAPIVLSKREKKAEIGKHRFVVRAILAAGLLAIVILAVNLREKATARPFEGQTLYIYNWGEYTGENVIPDFEEATGATVVMENFDSNEQMYIKVANG